LEATRAVLMLILHDSLEWVLLEVTC